MKWLITGARGQLGTDLQHALADSRDEVWAFGHADLDIADSRAVGTIVERIGPGVVINAAAYTAVDAAEADEASAFRVNAAGPATLANAVARTGGRLIQVSTDYVFSGEASRPYEVDDPPAPKSVYGRTKLRGEQGVREMLPDRSYVVRTAWVYGATGTNFVKTMARLESERESVTVVDDQHGSPTWSADLAQGLINLGRSTAPAGTYHCTCGGDTTWFGLARAIFEELGADPGRILPTTTDAFPRPAPRPAYSVLSDSAWRAAGLPVMRPWRDALKAAFHSSGDRLRAG